MEIPKMTEETEKIWKYFSSIKDSELYAILGGSPSYELFHKTEDHLGFKIDYRINEEIINKGKKRLEEILSQIKEELCLKWGSLKREYNNIIIEKPNALIALIIDVAFPLISKEYSWIPVTAIAELVLRITKGTLDNLCAPSP